MSSKDTVSPKKRSRKKRKKRDKDEPSSSTQASVDSDYPDSNESVCGTPNRDLDLSSAGSSPAASSTELTPPLPTTSVTQTNLTSPVEQTVPESKTNVANPENSPGSPSSSSSDDSFVTSFEELSEGYTEIINLVDASSIASRGTKTVKSCEGRCSRRDAIRKSSGILERVSRRISSPIEEELPQGEGDSAKTPQEANTADKPFKYTPIKRPPLRTPVIKCLTRRRYENIERPEVGIDLLTQLNMLASRYNVSPVYYLTNNRCGKRSEHHCKAILGHVLVADGFGRSMEAAKLNAAKEALRKLRTGSYGQPIHPFPRPPAPMPGFGSSFLRDRILRITEQLEREPRRHIYKLATAYFAEVSYQYGFAPVYYTFFYERANEYRCKLVFGNIVGVVGRGHSECAAEEHAAGLGLAVLSFWDLPGGTCDYVSVREMLLYCSNSELDISNYQSIPELPHRYSSRQAQNALEESRVVARPSTSARTETPQPVSSYMKMKAHILAAQAEAQQQVDVQGQTSSQSQGLSITQLFPETSTQSQPTTSSTPQPKLGDSSTSKTSGQAQTKTNSPPVSKTNVSEEVKYCVPSTSKTNIQPHPKSSSKVNVPAEPKYSAPSTSKASVQPQTKSSSPSTSKGGVPHESKYRAPSTFKGGVSHESKYCAPSTSKASAQARSSAPSTSKTPSKSSSPGINVRSQTRSSPQMSKVSVHSQTRPSDGSPFQSFSQCVTKVSTQTKSAEQSQHKPVSVVRKSSSPFELTQSEDPNPIGNFIKHVKRVVKNKQLKWDDLCAYFDKTDLKGLHQLLELFDIKCRSKKVISLNPFKVAYCLGTADIVFVVVGKGKTPSDAEEDFIENVFDIFKTALLE